jgi:hypothetical protein
VRLRQVVTKHNLGQNINLEILVSSDSNPADNEFHVSRKGRHGAIYTSTAYTKPDEPTGVDTNLPDNSATDRRELTENDTEVTTREPEDTELEFPEITVPIPFERTRKFTAYFLMLLVLTVLSPISFMVIAVLLLMMALFS